MPGKVNPVIPEAVSQAAMAVMGNDQMIVQAASAGNLELNPFLPLVADSLLDVARPADRRLRHLRAALRAGIEADRRRCRHHVDNSTATVTALVETDRLRERKPTGRELPGPTGKSIRELVVEQGLLTRRGSTNWSARARHSPGLDQHPRFLATLGHA